ncbi:unnamed protein product, partial [Discosporangium mesarthrocarpum]
MPNMSTPCVTECNPQRYPTYPYSSGADSILTDVLPAVLSIMTLIFSWMAGRYIDKIDVQSLSEPRRATPQKSSSTERNSRRPQSGRSTALQTVHHSSNKSQRLRPPQLLDVLSMNEEELQLYNEEYGSRISPKAQEIYDNLGPSPGAGDHGPTGPPKSPSLYSQHAHSIFSLSAHGGSSIFGNTRPSLGGGSSYHHFGGGPGGSSYGFHAGGHGGHGSRQTSPRFPRDMSQHNQAPHPFQGTTQHSIPSQSSQWGGFHRDESRWGAQFLQRGRSSSDTAAVSSGVAQRQATTERGGGRKLEAGARIEEDTERPRSPEVPFEG